MTRGRLICRSLITPDLAMVLGDTDLDDSVSNITDDTTMLTTSLAAKPVAWSDVAGSYELAFGHAVPVSQTRRLKRGFLSDIDTVANKVQSATKGDYNKTKSASLRLDAGHQNQRVNIFTDHK